MRRVLGSILVLVACEDHPSAPADERLLEHPPLQSCQGERPPGPLVVVTWNISAARRAPLEDVRATLAALDADVDRTGNVQRGL